MKTLNLVVHVATAVVLIGNGILLLLAAILISGISALFNGNFIGLLMMLVAAVFIGVGVATARTAFSIAPLILSDTATYLARELKLALWAVTISSVALFILLAFNSFRVEDVFSYGFGVFFVLLAATMAVNLVAYVLTMIFVH